MLLTDSNCSHEFQQIVNNVKGVPTEMWVFALPLCAYVLVGFCPTGVCPDTLSVDAYLLKNIPAKFHPDPIWNDGALGFLKRSPNKKNNNNKLSSDMRFVPPVKMSCIINVCVY